jgi:hypothetical protein
MTERSAIELEYAKNLAECMSESELEAVVRTAFIKGKTKFAESVWEGSGLSFSWEGLTNTATTMREPENHVLIEAASRLKMKKVGEFGSFDLVFHLAEGSQEWMSFAQEWLGQDGVKREWVSAIEKTIQTAKKHKRDNPASRIYRSESGRWVKKLGQAMSHLSEKDLGEIALKNPWDTLFVYETYAVMVKENHAAGEFREMNKVNLDLWREKMLPHLYEWTKKTDPKALGWSDLTLSQKAMEGVVAEKEREILLEKADTEGQQKKSRRPL